MRRTTCRVPTTPSQICKDVRTCNAFMQFLCTYRQQQTGKCPAWLLAAGELWSKMPLKGKYFYIEAARSAGYVYKSRDRRMNRVMRHLRKALHNDERTDLLQLSQAVKQMHLWKRKVLRDITDETRK